MERPQVISGQGRNTDIFFVEDYGTEQDFVHGAAITDWRETVLRQLLTEHKIKVEDTYRTLYIKDRLTYYGKARKKRQEAIKEALDKPQVAIGKSYYEILKEEIVILRPRVIVPLGDLSLMALANAKSVEKFRGSVLPLTEDIQSQLDYTARVIPTLPLQQLAHDFTARIYCNLDLQKAVLNRHNDSPIEDPTLIWIAKNAEEVKNYFARIGGAEYITFDIETIFGVPVCIGFSHNGIEGVCIPFLNDNTIDPANRALMLSQVTKFLSGYIPKVNQNIKYDQTLLERFITPINNIVFDTQIAAGLLYPELKKNLGFLTSIYTDMPYFKDEGREFDPKIHNKSRFYAYNAKDCISTWQIAQKQRDEIIEQGLKPLMYGAGLDTEPLDNPMGMMKLYHVYRKMDSRGLQIDDTKRKSLKGKYSIHLEVAEAKLRAMLGGKSINVNSPKQIGVLLYEDLKFPVRRKQSDSGTSSYNTEEEMLEQLAVFHPTDSRAGAAGKDIIETIIFARKLYKLIQTIETPVHYDNRLRCNYNLSGTENGRTSANKTYDEYFLLDEGSKRRTTLVETAAGGYEEKRLFKIKRVRLGHGLQTIGKHGFKYQGISYGDDIREMFVPSPGRVLVEADLSQAEARVDAVLAADYDILPRFDDQYGIHRLTASWVYGCGPGDIKKGTEEYHIGKTVRHAAERNMQPPRLGLMIQKPLDFSTRLLNKVHETQPKIRGVFHQDIRSIVRRTRALVAPNGRRRDFFGKLDESLYNEAISFLPQAIVGDQMKFSMIPFWEMNHDFPWLMEAHDSVLCELLPAEVESFAVAFKKIAERPIKFHTGSIVRDFELVIPVEIMVSDTNWHAMKELKI